MSSTAIGYHTFNSSSWVRGSIDEDADYLMSMNDNDLSELTVLSLMGSAIRQFNNNNIPWLQAMNLSQTNTTTFNGNVAGMLRQLTFSGSSELCSLSENVMPQLQRLEIGRTCKNFEMLQN